MGKSTVAMPWVGAHGLSLGNVHDSVQRFQRDFLRTIARAGENGVCSPVSAYVLLAMLEAAADGSTRAALRTALHIRPEEEDVPRLLGFVVRALFDVSGGDELENANTAWVARGLAPRPEFRTTIEGEYRATIAVVDPSSPRAESMLTQTGTHPARLLPRAQPVMTPDTLLVLTNAIWFKGRWSNPFPRERTAVAPFRLEDDPTTPIPVQMMSCTAPLSYAQSPTYTAVSLPYVSGLSMVIVLPRWSSLKRSRVADLEHTLAGTSPQQWIPATRYDEVTVYLPRFRVSWAGSLRPLCESLGLAELFVLGRANLSRAFGSTPTFVSDIRQEAVVELDEAGTRAEARTTAVMETASSLRPPPPTEPVTFRADHPFLFFIVRGQTVMFAGRVMQPREQ